MCLIRHHVWKRSEEDAAAAATAEWLDACYLPVDKHKVTGRVPRVGFAFWSGLRTRIRIENRSVCLCCVYPS